MPQPPTISIPPYARYRSHRDGEPHFRFEIATRLHRTDRTLADHLSREASLQLSAPVPVSTFNRES